MYRRCVITLCILLASAAYAQKAAAAPKNIGSVYTKKMVGGLFVRADLGVVRALTLTLPAGNFAVSAKIMFANGSSAPYQAAGCSLISSLSTLEIDKAYVRLDGGQVAMLPMIGTVSSDAPFTVSIDCTSDAIDGQVELGTLMAISVPAVNTQ